ncbi:MAG: hypothetical protein M3Q52_02130 [Pseudomonadota bacterium]|nr:hypothetical protein [Pseudomonadota bacterium]
MRRVALREYVPLAALVLAWLAIGATVGPADAVRLLAALTFVRAARSLTVPGSIPPLRKRLRSGEHQAQATRVVLLVEAIALPFAVLALGAIVALLWAADEARVAIMALLFAPALPVRFLIPLAARRAFGKVYRPTIALVGLTLMGAGALLGADAYVFALLFAARDWLALGISYLLAPQLRPRRGVAGEARIEELQWREVADHSYAKGRKLAAYRFGKTFLHALLGPFGTIAARTGRGLRMDKKFEPFVPRSTAALSLVALASATASIAIVLLVPEPALLVVAASLLRVSSASANVLIWGALSGNLNAVAPDDDDDEDDL